MVESPIATLDRIVFSMVNRTPTATLRSIFKPFARCHGRMDTETILKECSAEALQKVLGIQTEAGARQFGKQIRMITPKTGILQRRQAALQSMQTMDTSQFEKRFAVCKEVEPVLSVFFQKSKVEENSFEQLTFSSWTALQILNTIPFCLLALSYFKLYVVPTMALLTPIFMILGPYIFLKYVYQLPISTDQYIQIMLNTVGLQTFDLSNPKIVLQASLTVFSLGQSIYQPIQNAMHLSKINDQLLEKGRAVERFHTALNGLLEAFPEEKRPRDPLAHLPVGDPHRCFAAVFDHPVDLRLALQLVGDIEVMYRVASYDSFKPVRFVNTNGPYLEIQGGKNPFQGPEAVPFSLRLGGRRFHAILTGPNRGGKSSVLRSTLLTVVLAQTFGVAPGTVTLRPFEWIATGLRLEDRPGSSSLFESEVEFAVKILYRASKEPTHAGLILFDELFHSTNPPDGARTAELFLHKLWQQPNLATFISTHVFDLAKHADKTIQRLCVPAYKKDDGSLQFTYTLKTGICEVSSVDEILKEKGLLSAESSVPENQEPKEK